MRPFAALERFFERVFERPSARLFHAKLQPIQLQRRVERAMENGRLSASDRVVVPNRYLVRLAPADLHAFGDLADSLEVELADAALRFARAHRYSLADRPAIRLIDDPSIAEGDVRVEASFSDAPPPPALSHTAAPYVEARAPSWPEPYGTDMGAAPWANDAAPPRPADGIRVAAHPRAAASAAARPSGRSPAVPAIPSAPPAPPVPSAPPIDVTRTMVFEVPTVEAPLAVLREIAPDGSQRELTLDGGPVTIGRATDNTLVLRDGRVSRYHGRLTARQGALVYSDAGSTNGSRVNGVEIDEVVLGAGDRIELGDTVLVVESVAGN